MICCSGVSSSPQRDRCRCERNEDQIEFNRKEHKDHKEGICILCVLCEGMRFVSGVLKHSGSSCRTDGKWATISLLAANQQVDYGRCSQRTLGVTLRFCE